MSNPLSVFNNNFIALRMVQPPNVVYAGPTSSPDALPTFRALVAADIPSLPAYALVGHVHVGVYQPLDGDLTAISALATTGVVKRTALDTWSAAALLAGDIPDISGTYALTGHTHTRTWPLLAPTASADNVILSGTAGVIPFTLKASPGGSDVTFGPTLITNGTFDSDLSSWIAGAGWSWSAGTALHTAGNTATLTQAAVLAAGSYYEIQFDIVGRTAGSITLTAPSAVGSWSATPNGTYRFLFLGVAGTETVTFTPSSDFDGAIDNVLVRLIIASISSLTVYDSNAAILSEVRGSISLTNLAIGANALRFNSIGQNNLAIGINALQLNTVGLHNIALGPLALFNNTTGSYNIAIGRQALLSNTLGTFNIGIGTSALNNNTTGQGNFAAGYSALQANTIGGSNIGILASTLYLNTSGSNNIALGNNALHDNSTGAQNIAIGSDAGYSPNGVVANKSTTGSYQTFIGYQTGLGSTTQRQYATAIGAKAVVDAANAIVLGRADLDSVGIGIIAPANKLHVIVPDAGTSTVVNILALGHNSSGTPAAGFGTGLLFQGKSSTTVDRDMGRIRAEWITATDASRISKLIFSTYSISTEVNAVTINQLGSVGIMVSDPEGRLDVARDSTYTNHASAAILVKNQTVPAKQIRIGYDTAIDAGYIQSAQTSVGLKTLTLNPAGGGVSIGTVTPSSTLDVAGDVEVGSANAYYMGDPTTDGSWRMIRSGNDLVFQRRVTGAWVTKQTIAA